MIDGTPWLSSRTDRVTGGHVYFCINSGLSSIESRSKVPHF